MKNLTMVIAGVFFVLNITGCNTLKGAGKDVEGAGKSIQRTVDHND